MEPKSARVYNYWVYLLRSLGFAIWYICKTVMGPKSVKSLELLKITIKHNCYVRVVFSVNLLKYFRKLTYRRKRAVTKFYQISELWKPQTKMLFRQNLIKERRNCMASRQHWDDYQHWGADENLKVLFWMWKIFQTFHWLLF